MKYCSKCAVSVNSPVERCPLCYGALERVSDMPELQTYPNLAEKAARYNLVLRILLFLSLTAAGVCVTVNLLVTHRFSWSLIVVANIAYMWAAISAAVKKRARIGQNILIQVLSLAALMTGIDFFAGHNNWALNYVLPFLFISATLSITIIIIVKHVAIGEFILYFVLTALLGFIPVIMLAIGQVTVPWPAVTSAGYSALSLVSLFIFADNATKIELKKRFHI